MALSYDLGYTLGTGSFDLPTIPLHKADFVVKVDEPGEAIITNTTSPIDQPETIRFATQAVSNVYAGTDIEPTNYYATKKGASTVVQVRDILRVTDSTDPTFRVDIPLECHIVVRVPKTPFVQVSDVRAVINRAISALLPLDATGGSNKRIEELVRGVMVPSGLS